MTIIDPKLPPPAFSMTPRDLSLISDMIVHHSAGPLEQTVAQIDAEHRAIGDAMIGYNYVITPNGDTYSARPCNVVPAAAYGRNTQSVNVCLIGNFQKGDPGFTGPPTHFQLSSLIELGILLHHQFPTIVRTIGHRDVSGMFYNGSGDYSTACPGSELYAILPSIKGKIAAVINAR